MYEYSLFSDYSLSLARLRLFSLERRRPFIYTRTCASLPLLTGAARFAVGALRPFEAIAIGARGRFALFDDAEAEAEAEARGTQVEPPPRLRRVDSPYPTAIIVAMTQ